MIEDLIRQNRTRRRFDETESVSMETLRWLVKLARLSASGSNAQPLKFILSNQPEQNAKIFATLSWAGSLRDWPGPQEGERPTAYIIILCDREIRTSGGVDHGIAAQSIMLGATERGLGGCMLGAVKRDKLHKSLDIPNRYDILLVLALGKPVEEVVLETVGEDGDVKYYRDEFGVHHVPKRPLDELILREYGE